MLNDMILDMIIHEFHELKNFNLIYIQMKSFKNLVEKENKRF